MSNRKIKIRAIDAHKRKRNAALGHYGRLYRQCRTFHSLQQMDAFYEPAHRPLMEAQAAIREHRELGKDGRFLARIEMGEHYPPAHARTRGQWRRLAKIARARGMADAERLCDGYADGWGCHLLSLFPAARHLSSHPGKSPWSWWGDYPERCRTHWRHA